MFPPRPCLRDLAIARVCGVLGSIHHRRVAAMKTFTAPPGYVRTKPPASGRLAVSIAAVGVLFDNKSPTVMTREACSHENDESYTRTRRSPRSKTPIIRGQQRCRRSQYSEFLTS